MADVRLLREALAEAGDWCDLTVATTGAQALDMLFRRGRYNDLDAPDLVLLDIRLPILNGHEVLSAIKAHAPLNMLPVIILSTSGAEQDVRKAYSLGASCYIVKPRDLEQFIAICKSLYDFWAKRVRFPQMESPSAN